MKRKTPLPKKTNAIDYLKKKISESRIVILSDFRGLTVAQITKLRRELKKTQGEYRVVKNNLFKRALQESEIEHNFTGEFDGPIAVVFAEEDPVMPAKIIYKFSKDNEEKPGIKGGVFNRKQISLNDLKNLSQLPSREELIAKVVRGIGSPLYGIVNVLQGPIRKLVYVLDAIKNNKQG
jgi:large subunit ribosomal protein L10